MDIFKNKVNEAYKKWINFRINHGEEKGYVREFFLEKVNSNLYIYNDKTSVFYHNEKVLIEAIELNKLINELLPLKKKIEGNGILKENKVSYEFINVYTYKIFKDDNNYKIKIILSDNIGHKINGDNCSKFSFDPYKNIYFSKQLNKN